MSQPIFSRAPLHMRYSRESLFEPKFVSIGPLYYEKLREERAMKKAKNKCVLYFVSKLETSIANINDLIEKIEIDDDMKVQIHQWYGKSFVRGRKFLRMLVRDSCFIIRIILAFSRGGEESMFYPGVDIKTVRFDLLLLENQIPFFFLKKVYNLLRANNVILPQSPENSSSNSNSNSQSALPPEQIHTHLPQSTSPLEQGQTHLPQSTLTPEQSQTPLSQSTLPLEESQSQGEQTNNLDEFLKELKSFIWLDMPWQFDKQAKPTDPIHLLDLYWQWCIPSPRNGQAINESNQTQDDGKQETWVKIHHQRSNADRQIKNAYELYHSAGVTFQKTEHKHGFDVTFRNGILQMPHLQLDPNQTTLLANLVAFEELLIKSSKEPILTSYVLLLDGLISTEQDVELLEQHGVITNKLSSQKASAYFNDIGNVCSINYNHHYCKEQFDDLNSYYNSKWNRRFAKLQHKYLNSPWAVISLLAGLLLLILSIVQTALSIATYCRHR